jgi:hypothetical protein
MRFLVVFHVFLSVVSMTPKFCVNCKHYMGNDSYGKCAKSPIVYHIDDYLVTGVIPSKKKEYNFCSIVRKYGPECGPQGKLFEQKP